jgi:hypothetical protein
LVNATIKVSRTAAAKAEDPDPTMNLRLVAVDSYGLSFVTTSLYTSTVGDSFIENIRNLQTSRSAWSDINNSSYRTLVLDAIADSVTAVMDDSLVALGSAALTFPNATQIVNATAKISAVQIGSRPFIWATVAINTIGLIGVIASYLALWRANVPVFEYSDIGCMVLGLIQGMVVVNQDDRVTREEQQAWDGDPNGHNIGRLKARLETQELH